MRPSRVTVLLGIGLILCALSVGSGAQPASATGGLGRPIGAAKAPRKVFAVVSDAECNEGSIWEAVMFAAHHKLGQLTVIIDDNGQQAMGKTRDVLNLRPFAVRWQAFGWDAVDVDGHNKEALQAMLRRLDLARSRWHAVAAVFIMSQFSCYEYTPK